MQKSIEKLLELLTNHKEEFSSYTLKVHRNCLSLRVDDVEKDSNLYQDISSLLTHLNFERYIKEKSLSKIGTIFLVNLDF